MRHLQYNRMRVPRIFYCRESHRGCFPLWRLRTLCFDLDCATIEKKEAAESAGRKTMGKKLRLLFIGNSHTYYNDMPLMAAKKARAAGYDCEVTMIAHGGWFLAQHVAEPDVRFDILFGNYDYVILQEHAHPFGPEEKFFDAARKLNTWIREANSTPVIYMTWAMKEEEAVQPRMTKAHREIAEEIDALLAPVGEEWWQYKRITRKLKCMRRTAHMPPRRAQIWRHPASGKPFGQILKKSKICC